MLKLGFGLIGTGFIGKAHSIALNNASKTLNLRIVPQLAHVCSQEETVLRAFSEQFGYSRFSTDWKECVNDENVDVVVVGSPDYVHYEQAMGAIQAGKHLLCEKPVGMNAKECENLLQEAETAGIRHCVGYTYLANPAFLLAKEIITSGQIGEIYSCTSQHNEDYFSNPEDPFHWHCDSSIARYGALSDMGSHPLSMLISLFGMPSRLTALTKIAVKERRDHEGKMRKVETDDICNSILEYENGPQCTMESNRVSSGRKMYLGFTIHGSKGSVILDHEHMNSLQVYLKDNNTTLSGYRKVQIGPEHPYSKYFSPATAHGLGFNDFSTIQMGEFLKAILDPNHQPIADLRTGLKVQRIIDAIDHSSNSRSWVSL